MKQKVKIYIAVDDEGDIGCAFTDKEEAIKDANLSGFNTVEKTLYIESPGGVFIDKWDFV